MTDEVLVGKLVADRYRVVRRLGGGGMGTVYVAVQEPLGREVALKVVRRELAGEKRTVERFRREAKSLSAAHHPHIVTLYDFGELPSGALWFAMELVRGEDLRQRLARDGALPVKKTIAIIRDAASALAAAHAMGIIHRDLKPENILLMEAAGRPDFVKLVDFGVAKLPVEPDADPAEQHLTMRGMVVGTPGYIAPEVALHDVTNDARSDLYALGVVWFECLAGHPPFRARTATALMMMHATDPVPALPDEVPLPIAGLLQRMLAKSPDDRPASAEALLASLDALPPFDTGAVANGARIVARPQTPLTASADPSAATLDDNGRARAAPGTLGYGITGFGTSTDDDAAAPVAPVAPSAMTVERSTAVTEPARQTPLPLPLPPPPSRVPLLAAGAIVAVLAGVSVGYLTLRSSDAGDPAVTPIADAGSSTPIVGVVHPSVVDGGIAVVGVDVDVVDVVDAGTRRVKRKKPPQKTPGEGEYVPDLD